MTSLCAVTESHQAGAAHAVVEKLLGPPGGRACWWRPAAGRGLGQTQDILHEWLRNAGPIYALRG